MPFHPIFCKLTGGYPFNKEGQLNEFVNQSLRVDLRAELNIVGATFCCCWLRGRHADEAAACLPACLPAVSEVQFNLSDQTPSTISSTSRTEWICRDENRSIFGDQIPWRYKAGQFSLAHLMCCCCCWWWWWWSCCWDRERQRGQRWLHVQDIILKKLGDDYKIKEDENPLLIGGCFIVKIPPPCCSRFKSFAFKFNV